MSILEVKNVKKIYRSKGGVETEALKNMTFQAKKGEFISIMGESGSGKTTLLNIIATLDKPTEGSVFINGVDTRSLKDKEISSFRRQKLGFVFQDFNLLDLFNARDNIYLPLVLSEENIAVMQERLDRLAPLLGIEKLLNKYPYELSGGQKQRVAICRAMITNPDLILADEPTGALDSASADSLMRIFENIHKQGHTIMMVTHSPKAASFAERILFIQDGRIYHELFRGEQNRQQFIEKINQVQILMDRRGEVLEI